MYKFLLPNDNYVEWRKRTNEPLMDFFKESEWLNIFSDVTNVEQFEDFMNMDCGQCFVAYNHTTNTPFGFIYAYLEDVQQREVSIHGGGWLSNHAFLNYRAYIIMIDALLQEGFKVRTACQIGNQIAVRFNKSVRFINHYTSENYRYFWISEKRLHSSQIYQRLIV